MKQSQTKEPSNHEDDQPLDANMNVQITKQLSNICWEIQRKHNNLSTQPVKITKKLNHTIAALLSQDQFPRPHCENSEYRCPRCDKLYKELSVLKLHFTFCRGWMRGKKSYFHFPFYQQKQSVSLSAKCALCKKIFPSLIRLKAHMPLHGINQCAVPNCGKKFATYVHQNIHLKKHGAKIMFSTCPVCERDFHSKSMLEAHSLSHIFKAYHCPECNDVFRSLKLLLKHLKTHSHFECKLCQVKFEKYTDLVYHQKANGSFSCCDCLKKFASIFHFKTHKMMCKVGKDNCSSILVTGNNFKGKKEIESVHCKTAQNSLKGICELMKPLLENQSRFFFYCQPSPEKCSPVSSPSKTLKCKFEGKRTLRQEISSDVLNEQFSLDTHESLSAFQAASAG